MNKVANNLFVSCRSVYLTNYEQIIHSVSHNLLTIKKESETMQRFKISDNAGGIGVKSVVIPKRQTLKLLLISLSIVPSIGTDEVVSLIVSKSAAIPTGAESEQYTQQIAAVRCMVSVNQATAAGYNNSDNGQSVVVPCNDMFNEGDSLYVHLIGTAAIITQYDVVASFS